MAETQKFYEANGGEQWWDIVGYLKRDRYPGTRVLLTATLGGDYIEFHSPEAIDPLIEALTEARQAFAEALALDKADTQ
jgi:hypothetical protein